MRIIFMGTPDFAVPSLAILLDHGYEIPAVVTAPDKPGGRLGVQESAVKRFAIERGLRVLQPVKLRDPAFLDELRAIRADLQVVVAFRMLPEAVWQMPPLGTLNLHGSLLPKYRGAAPINWAIIKGERETGLTTFFLQHEIDTGHIILQRALPIGADETAGELHDRMMYEGAELVLETVAAIRDGNVPTHPQPDALATHAPKIFTETCKIDFEQPAQVVHNFIRGLSPFPGAWTLLHGKMFKILRSTLQGEEASVQDHLPAGTYRTDGKTYLQVKASDAYVTLLEVQLEGKRRMTVKELLNGYKNFN